MYTFFTIGLGLSTLSLCNAALLVHGFYNKLRLFADFLYLPLILLGGGFALSYILCVNEPKKTVAFHALAPLSMIIYHIAATALKMKFGLENKKVFKSHEIHFYFPSSSRDMLVYV